MTSQEKQYSCQYCKKIYKRESAFNNHIITCKISRHMRDKLNPLQESLNIENLMKMILDLNCKYEKLEKDYNEIKKYVNVSKNKINIIDFLNEKYIDLDLDIQEFIEEIDLTESELDKIFKNDYVNGIIKIIFDKITEMREKMKIEPIKAFSNKENILYVYNKFNNCWNILTSEQLDKLIVIIDKKILCQFLKWKLYSEQTYDKETFSEIYVMNLKRVVGGNFENKDKKLLIKSRLYKLIKTNLKNIISYEFE